MMKVNMERVYCCGYEMEIKAVIDVENKRGKAMYICKKCNSYFKIRKPFIANLNEKNPFIGVR